MNVQVCSWWMTNFVVCRNYKPESGSLQEVTLPAEAPADVETLVKTQLDDGEKAKEEVQVCVITQSWQERTYAHTLPFLYIFLSNLALEINSFGLHYFLI